MENAKANIKRQSQVIKVNQFSLTVGTSAKYLPSVEIRKSNIFVKTWKMTTAVESNGIFEEATNTCLLSNFLESQALLEDYKRSFADSEGRMAIYALFKVYHRENGADELMNLFNVFGMK